MYYRVVSLLLSDKVQSTAGIMNVRNNDDHQKSPTATIECFLLNEGEFEGENGIKRTRKKYNYAEVLNVNRNCGLYVFYGLIIIIPLLFYLFFICSSTTI